MTPLERFRRRLLDAKYEIVKPAPPEPTVASAGRVLRWRNVAPRATLKPMTPEDR